MKDPRTLSISDFTYSLPEAKIASYPLAQRDQSRLLVYKEGIIQEHRYREITHLLPPGSLMIFNDTRVIEARLLFQKSTGGVIELFCLEPAPGYPDITTAMSSHHAVRWKCLVGGASKWKHGQVLSKNIVSGNRSLTLSAQYLEKKTDHFVIGFSWTPTEYSFAEVLHLAGAVPLPPYIKREVEKEDAERYQTIYANFEGSVAAPTAGLHFTQQIFDSFPSRNIEKDFVTLHVGAGTFKPVKSDSMAGHEMHGEFFEVSKRVIEHILEKPDDRKIVAVGTTSLRTIESLYWLGVKQSSIGNQQSATNTINRLELGQWEAYSLAGNKIPVKESLETLLEWMSRNRIEKLIARTEILIAPGYEFKIIDGLVTNFHQPQSTLLLLVAAFIGNDWKKVYQYALENDFRFLSYGDGCLLWRDQAS